MRIDRRLSLFDTYWFVMVTITTVGYGDIAPSHWTTKLLVTFFLISGIAFLIPQVEELYTAFVVGRRGVTSLVCVKMGVQIRLSITMKLPENSSTTLRS